MSFNGVFGILDISASGLSAQRKNLEVRASNIANMQSVDSETGQPYRAREVQFNEIRPRGGFTRFLRNSKLRLARLSTRHLPSLKDRERELAMGVEAAQFEVRDAPTKKVYAPDNPNADEQGYIETSDINVVDEMVKLLSASRAYEANVTVVGAAKNMFNKALEI